MVALIDLLFWSCFLAVSSLIRAGESSAASLARASSSSSLVKYMVPNMHKKLREMADLRPYQMRYDDGGKLFVGIASPEYVDSTMSTTTIDNTLDTLYDRVKGNVRDGLRSLREECLRVTRGVPWCPDGPHDSGQLGVYHLYHVIREEGLHGSYPQRACDASVSHPTADYIRPLIETVRFFSFVCC